MERKFCNAPALHTFGDLCGHPWIHLYCSYVFGLFKYSDCQISGSGSNLEHLVRGTKVCLGFVCYILIRFTKTNSLPYLRYLNSKSCYLLCLTMKQAHLCAIWGFFRICCPNRSVLNMGLRTPASPLSLPCEEDPDAFGLMGSWCFRENLSDVARGMLSLGRECKAMQTCYNNTIFR